MYPRSYFSLTIIFGALTRGCKSSIGPWFSNHLMVLARCLQTLDAHTAGHRPGPSTARCLQGTAVIFSRTRNIHFPYRFPSRVKFVEKRQAQGGKSLDHSFWVACLIPLVCVRACACVCARAYEVRARALEKEREKRAR